MMALMIIIIVTTVVKMSPLKMIPMIIAVMNDVDGSDDNKGEDKENDMDNDKDMIQGPDKTMRVECGAAWVSNHGLE